MAPWVDKSIFQTKSYHGSGRRWCFGLSFIFGIAVTILFVLRRHEEGDKKLTLRIWTSIMVFLTLQAILFCFLRWVPQIRFKSKPLSIAIRTIFKLAEPLCVLFFVPQFEKINPVTCFFIFSNAYYYLAAFNIVVPHYDFTIPSVLAISSIHLSSEEEKELDKGHVRAFVVTLGVFFFLLKAIVQLSSSDTDDHSENTVEYVNTMLFNLKTAKCGKETKGLRMTWVTISIVISIILSVLVITYGFQNNLKSDTVILLGFCLFMGLIILSISMMFVAEMGPLIRFGSKYFGAFIRGFLDLFAALLVVVITIHTQNPNPYLYYVYVFFSGYSMAILKVIVPLIECNIPLVFAASAIHLARKNLSGSSKFYPMILVVVIYILEMVVEMYHAAKKEIGSDLDVKEIPLQLIADDELCLTVDCGDEPSTSKKEQAKILNLLTSRLSLLLDSKADGEKSEIEEIREMKKSFDASVNLLQSEKAELQKLLIDQRVQLQLDITQMTNSLNVSITQLQSENAKMKNSLEVTLEQIQSENIDMKESLDVSIKQLQSDYTEMKQSLDVALEKVQTVGVP